MNETLRLLLSYISIFLISFLTGKNARRFHNAWRKSGDEADEELAICVLAQLGYIIITVLLFIFLI